MAAFLKRLLCFGLYAMIFYVLLIVVWAQFPIITPRPNLAFHIYPHSLLYTRLKEVEKTRNVDILFLGSSHTYGGFDPRIFAKNGFSSFNLGSGAQTPIQTELLLNRYLDQLKPKLIVYEVFPENFAGDGSEAAGDVLSSARIDFLSLKMALKTNHLMVYNTLIYGTIRDALGLDSNPKVKTHNDEDTYIPGGFVESARQPLKAPVKWEPTKKLFNPKQRDTFHDIMTMLRTRGYRVVLVQAPITKDLFNSYTNSREIDTYFKSQCKDYFNFNRIMDLSYEFFYDSHHLTQRGVEVFDEELIRLLKTEKILEAKNESPPIE